MRTLIKKELRENLVIAVLGLIVLSCILFSVYRDYSQLMRHALADGPLNFPQWQPLKGLATSVGWFSVVLGVVLGWKQIRNESPRDRWGFLVHRPITRTQIFWAKVTGGVLLQAAATWIPLSIFIIWAAIPGNVAAPFSWKFIWALILAFLMGVLFYFAAMLSMLRQARWWGSRALAFVAAIGIIFPLIFSGSMRMMPIVIVMSLIGSFALLWAARGAFQSGGFYSTQPATGKLAILVLFTIANVVIIFPVIGIITAASHRHDPEMFFSYRMTENGKIYKVAGVAGAFRASAQWFDLEGRPAADTAKLRNQVVGNYRITPTHDMYSPGRVLAPTPFGELHHGARFVWYYHVTGGKIVGYDMVTRQVIGSLGLEGFSDVSRRSDRFDWILNNWLSSLPDKYRGGLPYAVKLFGTDFAVYKADFQKKKLTTLFTASPDDPIQGATYTERLHSSTNPASILIATKKQILVLTLDGEKKFQAAYELPSPKYETLSISVLKPEGTYALWMSPAYENRNLPTKVAFFSSAGNAERTIELPAVSREQFIPTKQDRMAFGFASPLLMAGAFFLEPNIPSNLVWPGFVGAVLICVPVGFGLGRRYNFSRGAQAGWAVYLLLFGIPGLLTFLSLQEWPTRVSCPNCGKPRTVDHEACDHCGATFPQPANAGTEVFETASERVSVS